ncbi:serine/threonine-protein kinase [uncultured Microbacterium sp.]|uniref:serine/threonine-protein kinase n=1 Tax=uncultured Microbacterium sp. TaxID=191216 RepID=UPI0025D2BDC6|nr:serine/threonine protein kinase [uncultured Microbacterium sp.]
MSRPPSPPPQLDGFDYVEPLGTGGFADVFLYEQQQPRRQVAVKVLLADRLASGAAQEFADEANVMAMLSTHPAIVTIYQTGVAADGRPYLVMEYCPRPNLQQRARTEPFSVAETLRVGVQVAGAVETAHRAGVLHRDIKPANILVTAYNRPALTDFGIASTTGAVDEAAGMSIPWSPPESFADPPRGGVRSDVYALTATVYTLLTGRSPFEKPGQRNSGADLISRIETEPLPPVGRADVPDSLMRLLARGMAKNPDDRFGSAVAFARALQKVQIELSHSVTPIDIVDDHPLDPDPEDDADGRTRVREVVQIDPGHTATRPSATTSPVLPASPPTAPGPRFDAPARTADDDETVIRAPQVIPPTAQAPVAPHPASVVPGSAPGASQSDPTVRRAPRTVDPVAAVPTATPSSAPPVEPPSAHTGSPRSRRGLVWTLAAMAAVILLVGGSVLAVNLLNAGAPSAKPTTAATAEPQDPLADLAPPPKDLVATPTGSGQVHVTWTNPSPQDGDSFLVTVVRLDGDGAPVKADAPEITIPAESGGKTCVEVVLRRENGSASSPVRGCTP